MNPSAAFDFTRSAGSSPWEGNDTFQSDKRGF
uniref:Uncharacterized protein n=1 Tax=Anguilla anguilla TaxID=7936 RepID=A0A0E9TMS1_ANGAN